MENKVGRPSKYDPKYVDMLQDYLQTTGREQTSLPTVEGFAVFLDTSKQALYRWSRHHKQFRNALRKLMTIQAKTLIDDGIYGGKEVNASIVKLLLMSNHGMREKNDTDVTSGGESVNPILVRFIDKKDGDTDTK